MGYGPAISSTATRECIACGQSLPLTTAHFKARTVQDNATGVRFERRCRPCALEHQRACINAPAAPQASARAFDVATVMLEKEYGPLPTWPRAVHEEHTRLIRQLLGQPLKADALEKAREIVLDYGSPLQQQRNDAMARGLQHG